ncbi:MAG TPA: hypothetical protein VEX35_07800 [Allosphingosinicella sp.]|nr:hypothetical protein [Allosphingosinicella sp.]
MGLQVRSFLLALLLAGPAHAQSEADRDCTDDNGVDRCAAAQQARVRALYGVETIEAHRDAGDQVRRVFYVDGYGYDIAAIAFLRRPGHDPEVRVHFKREEGGPLHAPMVAPVPIDDWELLIERSAHFDRALVPRPEPPRFENGEELVTVCLHASLYMAEATDPAREGGEAATLRRRAEGGCSRGTTGAFAREVSRAALPLFPHCALLNPSHYRTPADQLVACRVLSGDRPAAAQVRNQLEALSWADTMAELPEIARLFDNRTRIEWNGELHAGREADGAARFFLAKMLEGGRRDLVIDSIEGLSDRRVRFRGNLVRSVARPDGQEEVSETAPVEMIWELEYRGRFMIRSLTVGPSARPRRR